MSDREYSAAKAIALRLLLAQISQDTDALSIALREIEPELLEHPDRMRNVLAGRVGIAAAEVIHRHGRDKEAAAKSIENMLAKALDDDRDSWPGRGPLPPGPAPCRDTLVNTSCTVWGNLVRTLRIRLL
jgi:hypothetical protein